MTLRRTIEVVNDLSNRGVIGRYAITDAVGALNYIEPTLTEDLDILISVDAFETRASGLILLDPIERALVEMGYTERSDVGYMVEGWPVQFLPVASELDDEALEHAIEVQVDDAEEPPFKARVLSAEHLVAIALKVGRLKDLARIEAFLEQSAVDLRILKSILERHKLTNAWSAFCAKAGRNDPLVDE